MSNIRVSMDGSIIVVYVRLQSCRDHSLDAA